MNGESQIRNIKKDLENIEASLYWFCPNCGQYGNWDSIDSDECICPICHDSEIYDMSMSDYFNDDSIYDIEYRVDNKYADTIRSVRVCVAYGGPNIYIDTADHKIKCAWWFDYCEVDLTNDVCDAINEFFNEVWNV